MAMPRLQAANLARTSLQVGCGASDTSITVTSSSGFPTPPFRIFVGTQSEYEIMEVTSVAGTTWTVLRGQEGTTSRSFNAGTYIENRFTQGTYNELVSGPSSAIDGNLAVFDGTTGTIVKDGGAPLTLGETSSTAYRGDRGKTAYDHSQDTSGDVHGATSAATANAIIRRDSAGRAKVAAPSDSNDIAIKDTVDTHANATDAHSATSSATANRIILRDSSGRAQVADPVADADIATRGYCKNIAISLILDSGGVGITSGTRGYIEIPFACTITGWTIVSDVTGSIVIDVRRATYANFPTVSSIAGSEKPTISSARKNQDLNLTTWNTSIAAGDILEFVVESASSVRLVGLTLRAVRA